MTTQDRLKKVAAAIREADVDLPLTAPLVELHEHIQAVYLSMADAAIEAHLSTLAAEGYAVVKLPEPTSFSHFQESVWDVGESSVILDRWKQVSIHLDDWDDEGPSPAEVQALAAALLAADCARSANQQHQAS